MMNPSLYVLYLYECIDDVKQYASIDPIVNINLRE